MSFRPLPSLLGAFPWAWAHSRAQQLLSILSFRYPRKGVSLNRLVLFGRLYSPNFLDSFLELPGDILLPKSHFPPSSNSDWFRLYGSDLLTFHCLRSCIARISRPLVSCSPFYKRGPLYFSSSNFHLLE